MILCCCSCHQILFHIDSAIVSFSFSNQFGLTCNFACLCLIQFWNISGWVIMVMNGYGHFFVTHPFQNGMFFHCQDIVFSFLDSIESNTCFSFDFILSHSSMLLIGLNGGLVAVGVVFIFSLAPDGHGGSMSFSVNHSSCHCAFLSHLLCWWLHCPCLFFCFMLWSLTCVVSCCCTHCHYSSSQMFS